MKRPKKKTVKIILLALVILLIIAVVAVVLVYNKHVEKTSNLVLYTNADGSRQVYILGTVHDSHFRRIFGYSYLDIQNAVASIGPDILLLEADQQIYDQYGVISAPTEMVAIWCYAAEQGIDMRGVDWFRLAEDSRSGTTDAERDDNIFYNVLAELSDSEVALVIVGSTHRMELAKRFEAAGYTEQNIADEAAIFAGMTEDDFRYPAGLTEALDQRIDYLQTIAVDEILAITEEGGKGRAYWLNHYEELALDLARMRDELLIQNRLYW